MFTENKSHSFGQFFSLFTALCSVILAASANAFDFEYIIQDESVIITEYTGSDEDVIEQALQGVNVAVLTDCGRMGNYVKEMGILNAAYFADSYEEMEKFMNTDVVKPHMDESTCFLLPARRPVVL